MGNSCANGTARYRIAFRDLGEFLKLLDERGELIRVRAPVDPEPEITEITDRVSKGPAEQNKALLFENVKGCAPRSTARANCSA